MSHREAAAALLLLALAGCVDVQSRGVQVLDSRTGPDRPATYLGLPLRSGQVVLSEAPGPYSFLFSLCPEQHFNFTHGAILSMENGQPYVYDMSGEYVISCVDRPTDAIEGKCRRIPFFDYCQPNLYVEVYDPPAGVDGEAVAAWAQARYREQQPFDPYFHWEDEERLFCTQFVYKALEAGGAPPLELAPIRQGASVQRLLTWFAIDRERSLPAGMFADPDRYAAALGQLNRSTAYCYFAAKRELHRRFTDDQLIGNVFVLHSAGDIELRPSVHRFLERAMALYPPAKRLPPLDELQAKVAKLAEEMLGVAPNGA